MSFLDYFSIFVIILAVFFSGILLGVKLRFSRNLVGTFTINHTNPDENLFSIQFEKDVTAIRGGNVISFKLKVK